MRGVLGVVFFTMDRGERDHGPQKEGGQRVHAGHEEKKRRGRGKPWSLCLLIVYAS